ncbi:hypothetical protein [Spongiimicrobium sp. 3-5]|uniref:hypothetical protein n=1 Tax=Spongiimicrobium sp. 3-5 TaxID=3332596 RepID=UPI00398118A4
MKTSDLDQQFAQEVDSNSYILRLERNSKDLAQMRNKLNSYLCEPKTYTLFERFETLCSQVERLTHANMEIQLSLKKHKRLMKKQVQRVTEQLSEFQKLEKNVSDYMSGARNC